MKCIAALILSSAVAFGQSQFVSGQAARAEIGQPNFTAQNLADPSQNPPTTPTASLLGAAGGVAYANGSLFVVDSNRVQAFPVQNRVMIYNNISSQIPAPDQQLITTGVRCPVCQATANVVVGQTDFTGSDPGVTAGTLNTPDHVASDGHILVISDTNNNRVLIYNSIPTSNGAPASVVLGQSNFTTGKGSPNPSASSLLGPEGVWLQNGRLFVADTNNNRVLIWNKIPTSNNQPADVVLGQPSFTSRSPVLNPPVNAQTMLDPVSVTSDGTHVFVTDLGNNRVLVWNSIPASNGQAADLEIGQPDFTTGDANHVTGICPSTTSGSTTTYPYECAATLNYPRFALSDGTRLFIADGGNDRVIVFDSIPTKNGARGKFVLGQPNEYENIIANGSNTAGGTNVVTQASASSMITPTALAWDGANLYVADPVNRRVLVYTPGQNLVPNTGITNAASREVFSLGSVTITDSAITAGDTLTISIGANSSATPTAYTYTVVKGDTIATIIAGLVSKINGSNSGKGDPNALAIDSSASAQVILVAKQGGKAGDNITLAATTAASSTSNAATETATASGATLSGGQDASQVAPGTLISVFAFGGLTDQPAAAAPAGQTLPRQLAGVELYVDGMRAPLMYVSDSQINAQIPFEVSNAQSVTTWVRSVRQDGSVRVSAAVGVPIVSANPGIFANGGSEPRLAVALHGSSYGTGVVSVDGSVNAGDVGTITIGSKAYTYTVVANDTLTSIENAFIRQINANTSEKVTASAAGAFNRIILTAKAAGSAGDGIPIAVSVSSSAKLLLTVLARSISTTSGSTTTTTYATCCSNTAGALVTTSNPAKPDEIINLYATGLGQVLDPSGASQGITGEPYKGPLTNAQQSVDALINGSSTANVLFTGLAPGTVGIYLVQLQLGDNLTTNLNSQLRIAQGINTSNIVSIPVVKP